MDWQIPLADIDFGPEESAAVQQVLDSGWLTMGPATQAFEEEFASYLGVKHAIAVTNGTAALHLACLAAGIGPGDEVIVPSLTFVATANAVRYTGAQVVFADIQAPHDLCISPGTIQRCLTGRTRAIIVMHYGGYPCDMPGIIALARERGLIVIEDAAHAAGSELDGRKLGTWGQIGCFSFFSNKNLTTGEGGMLVTDDDSIAERLRPLRSHGMTSVTWDRHQGHAWSYDVDALGYNYRIDEIRSALGRVQLVKLEKNNSARRHITSYYREILSKEAPRVLLPFENTQGISACHLFPILLPKNVGREAFMERMKAEGIQTSIHYPPVHKFKAYFESSSSPQGVLPVTEDVSLHEVTLPLYPAMRAEQVEIVVQKIKANIEAA
jgi:dTDP-4-amino-4,6-dideoxygalactose transaminase